MKGNLWKVSDLLDETDIRFAQKQFFDLRSGYEYYGLTEKVLMRMAREAGAIDYEQFKERIEEDLHQALADH